MRCSAARVRALAVTVMLVGLTPLARAGDHAPRHPALEGLGARIVRAGKSPAPKSPASRFAPSGQRMLVGPLLESMVTDAAQRTALREVIDAVFAAYETEAAKAGVANDVAGALAFFLVAHYSAAHSGEEVSDAASEALARQLQVALDIPEMRAAKDEEKQHLYEFFLFLSSITLARLQTAIQQADAAEMESVRAAGEEGLRTVLSADPSRISMSSDGLVIRALKVADAGLEPAVAPRASPAAGGGAFTYDVPQGWTASKGADGTVTLSRTDGDDFYGRSRCSVILPPPAAPGGDLVGAVQPAWKATFAPAFDGTMSPFPMRRRVGAMNCAFGQGELTFRSNGALFDAWLYLIDAGGATVTVVVLLQGDQTLYLESIERILASIRAGPEPKPGPLFAVAEIAGTWEWSSTSLANFVDTAGQYAGDASIAVGETLTLAEDGTYRLQFGGVGRGKIVRGDEKGRFRIDGDQLVLVRDGDEAQASRRRLLGAGTWPDGGVRVLLLLDLPYDLRPANIRFYGQRFVRK